MSGSGKVDARVSCQCSPNITARLKASVSPASMGRNTPEQAYQPSLSPWSMSSVMRATRSPGWKRWKKSWRLARIRRNSSRRMLMAMARFIQARLDGRKACVRLRRKPMASRTSTQLRALVTSTVPAESVCTSESMMNLKISG